MNDNHDHDPFFLISLTPHQEETTKSTPISLADISIQPPSLSHNIIH
jgi:hypothetical protein